MTQQITLTEARRRGWTIERGAYTGTTDDRRDRWYVYRLDAYNAVDRRGPGYATRREALEALDHQLGPRYAADSDSACDIANDAIRAEIGRQLNEAESEVSGEDLWDRCMAAGGDWATEHDPATWDEITDTVQGYYRPIIAAAIRELS